MLNESTIKKSCAFLPYKKETAAGYSMISNQGGFSYLVE